MFEKLPEEEEFKKEMEIVSHAKNLLVWLDLLNKLRNMKKPFYLIGFNPKLKTTICRKVKSKEEAYLIIKQLKLQHYVFAENVFKQFNMGD